MIEFNTITTDTEIALINGVNYNFKNFKRIGCCFHLNQDIIRKARSYGLLNSKSKSIDINETNIVITVLSVLPLTYKGNMENFNYKINEIIQKYPKYKNYINNYRKLRGGSR